MKRSNLTKIAVASRTPHGVRGLKFTIIGNLTADPESHPSRGAWIEMFPPCFVVDCRFVAPLTGCVD